MRWLGPLALLLMLFLPTGRASAAGGGAWVPAGALATARRGHTAMVLRSGMVLVVGGQDETPAALRSTEIYDPVTGIWRRAGDLGEARFQPVAAPLPDGGALVFGGSDRSDEKYRRLVTAERYDPAGGTWRPAAAQPDIFLHTAVPLPDGTVLAAGIGQATYRYDPAADAWCPAGQLPSANGIASQLLLLPDGTALFLGYDQAARYDAGRGAWREVRANGGPFLLLQGWAAAAALADGTVLLVGSEEAGIFDPVAETYRAVGAPPTPHGPGGFTLGGAPAPAFALAALPDGGALIAGGRAGADDPDDAAPRAAAERYDPAARAWRAAPPLASPRSQPVAVPLPDGAILVIGGRGAGGAALAAAERFVPGAGMPGMPSVGGGWAADGSLLFVPILVLDSALLLSLADLARRRGHS